MCLHNIAVKYIDTGVTDAITKHDAYVASKAFTPSNITKWVSTVEHAWAGWRNTVTDPEHMSAVELVREILSSDNEDWKQWAFSFATQQGDKPYTVADLLEKVVNQYKLLNAGGTKKKATALYAGHGVTQSGRHFDCVTQSISERSPGTTRRRASRRSVVQPKTAKNLSR
jgi:hypothetical protein